MNENDLRLLKSSVDKLVKIHCFDGEVLVAKVLFVWDEYGDVSYDIVSSTRTDRYEKYGLKGAYTISFQDIASVEAVSKITPGAGPGGHGTNSGSG